MAGESHHVRGTIKFVVWTAVSVGIIVCFWAQYYNGSLLKQYYYKTKTSGWAVNATAFDKATKDNPATLQIGSFRKSKGCRPYRSKRAISFPLTPPEHDPEPAARQRAAVGGGRRAVEGLPVAAVVALGLQRRRASTSSSTCGSSSTRASAPTSTSRATGSTPRSISTPSRPPSARSRRGSRRSRAGPTGSSPGRPTVSTWIRGPTPRTTAAGRRRRISRGWWSRSTPRPATSGRWWAAATSRTASSTARRRRSASRGPPSSRSSTRRRSRRAIRCRT